MDFRILGPLEVAEDGRTIDVGAAKQQTLLGALLLHPGEVLSTQRLIDELWGEVPPPSAAKAVQSYVCCLRQALGRATIVTRAGGYSVTVAPERLDALRFECLAADGEALLHERPAEAAQRFRAALALWRGGALEGLVFGSRAGNAVRRLEERRLTALERRVEADLARGGCGELVAELQELVAAHPYRETLRAQLMLALYRAGRQTDALAVFRDTRRLLADELGLEPGPALAQLERQVLQHAPQLHPPAAPPPQAAPQPIRPTHDARRLVTALAVRAATPDPEALHDVLDRCTAIIEHAGGHAERYLGDAVVGLFGAGDSHEDDPLRAARAALELRAAVATLRVAIETGEAFVRTRPDGATVTTGEAIAAAGRLAERAAEGEVLLGARVRGVLAAEARIDDASGLLLDLRTDDPAAPRAGATPFVGRARELAVLRAAFERVCCERVCHVVTIVGPPGIGKSRLAAEFAAEITERATVLTAACGSYGEGIACPLLGELIGQLGRDPPARIHELLADDARSACQLLGAAGISAQPAQAGETPPAVRRLLERLAHDRPLVILLEDVQWAQAPGLDLIDYLAAFSIAVPILLLCLARPELLEARPAWASPQPERTLRVLGALADRHAAALVERAGGGARTARIVAAAEGNPLFLEQLVAAGNELPDGTLPASVQAVLSARIGRLEPAERELLRCGAVEGRTFHTGALAALLATRDRGATQSLLVSLARKGLIRAHRAQFAGEDAFRFEHALIRETVYGEIPKRTRADLHAGIAEWLGERSDAPDELCGYHRERAWRLRSDLGATGELVGLGGGPRHASPANAPVAARAAGAPLLRILGEQDVGGADAAIDAAMRAAAWPLQAYVAWSDAPAAAAGDPWTRGALTVSDGPAEERELPRILRAGASAHAFGPTSTQEAIRRCGDIAARLRTARVIVAVTLPRLASLHAMSGNRGLARTLVREVNAIVGELGGIGSEGSCDDALVEMLTGEPTAPGADDVAQVIWRLVGAPPRAGGQDSAPEPAVLAARGLLLRVRQPAADEAIDAAMRAAAEQR